MSQREALRRLHRDMLDNRVSVDTIPGLTETRSKLQKAVRKIRKAGTKIGRLRGGGTRRQLLFFHWQEADPRGFVTEPCVPETPSTRGRRPRALCGARLRILTRPRARRYPRGSRPGCAARAAMSLTMMAPRLAWEQHIGSRPRRGPPALPAASCKATKAAAAGVAVLSADPATSRA